MLLPAIRRVSGNNFMLRQDSAPAHRAEHARLHQETPNFLLAPNVSPPNIPDLSPGLYEIWAVLQHLVDHRQIHTVDGLKRRLIDVWCSLEQSILTRLLTSSDEDIELKEGISSTACELAMLILSISVTFNVTCSTVTSLITKSCQ